MPQIHYTAFVKLGSNESDIISTDVVAELSEEETEKLDTLKSSYQGKPHHIYRAVHDQLPGIHHKLKKQAFTDVECLLTENAVENGYSEVYDEDLFEKDCENGQFVVLDGEDNVTALTRWREEEATKIQSMSRQDRTAYLSSRYIIELDFDENDYNYWF